MLTGDNERTAHHIAEELGVDRVYAQLLPKDKSKVLQLYVKRELVILDLLSDWRV
ncbi:MAG TPA: hypothetical protein V6C95_21705 [Coleofasciculaceae cyanobacterium]